MIRRPLTIKPNHPVSSVTPPQKIQTEPENPVVTPTPEGSSFSDNVEQFIKRIGTKGTKPFDAVFEAMAEVPTNQENGVKLTHAQACRMFDVTSMTIYKWRQKYGLPIVHLEGGKKPPVRYDEGMLIAWARAFNKKVVHSDYKEWE